MENEMKAQILKDIMQAMIGMDGDRLRPQAPDAAMIAVKDDGGATGAPAEAGHDGAEGDDMSGDDAKILESLLGGDDEDDKAAK